MLAEHGLQSLYETLEVPLVPVLADMERVGIRVDRERLAQLTKELDTQLDTLLREIHQLAGEPVNPNSPKQLATVLFEKLKLPPLKRTKTGYSTDVDVLEELALGHPLPGKILEYRQLAKLKGTYADALPTLIHPRTGRIHTSFNQLVAATGRLSSSNPNLQNIPIRSELGRRIRQAFIPDDGWRFVAADYSQIELRILAHFTEEPALVEAFLAGADIHTRTAAQIMGVGARGGDGRDAAPGQGGQLRDPLRPLGIRPLAGGVDRPRRRPAVHRRLLRDASPRAGLHRPRGGGGPGAGLRHHAPRAAAVPAGAPRAEPRRAGRGRADGGQRAHPGDGVRHHQAGDGEPGAGARRAGAPEPHAAPGARRAAPRGAGGRGRRRCARSCPRSWRRS